MLADLCGHIFQLFGVVPDLVKQAQVRGRKGRLVHLVDEVRDGVALLVAEIDSGEPVQGHVGRVGAASLHARELLHRCFGAVAAELGLAPYPVGALLGHCPLGELVAKLDFKLAAVEAALAVELGDVELLALLANLVADLVGHKGGRGEDEVQLIDLLQLGFQRLEGVHRKARCGDLEPCPWPEGLLEVIAQQAADVVDQFHQSPAPESLLIRLAAIHSSRSLRRKRHVPPSLKAGSLPSAARR